MRKCITPKLKKEITQNWCSQFPGMGIYKDMWLMNICGPLVVGIALMLKLDNTIYKPVMHIYDLCNEQSMVGLMAPIDEKSIYVDDKINAYLEVAEKFKQQTYIPFEGDVYLNQLIVNMKKNYDITYDPTSLLETMLSLAVWSGSSDVFNDVKEYVDYKISTQPDLFGTELVKNEFLESLPQNINDCEKYRNTVDIQIKTLKLTHLPRRELII